MEELEHKDFHERFIEDDIIVHNSVENNHPASHNFSNMEGLSELSIINENRQHNKNGSKSFNEVNNN